MRKKKKNPLPEAKKGEGLGEEQARKGKLHLGVPIFSSTTVKLVGIPRRKKGDRGRRTKEQRPKQRLKRGHLELKRKGSLSLVPGQKREKKPRGRQRQGVEKRKNQAPCPTGGPRKKSNQWQNPRQQGSAKRE